MRDLGDVAPTLSLYGFMVLSIEVLRRAVYMNENGWANVQVECDLSRTVTYSESR